MGVLLTLEPEDAHAAATARTSTTRAVASSAIIARELTGVFS
jgi:hypothetical protein